MLLFGFSNGAFAQKISQSQIVDQNTWLSIAMKYDLSKKWEIEWKEQFRLERFSTKMDQFSSQFNIRYKLTKNWKTKVGFRLIQINDQNGNNTGIEHHFRWQISATKSLKYKRFKWKNRYQYQRRNQLFKTSLQGDNPMSVFRFKTSLYFNIRKWKFDPEVSSEWFCRSQRGRLNGITNNRITLGSSYKFSKTHRIQFSYMVDRELRLWKPEVDHVLRVGYVLMIK